MGGIMSEQLPGPIIVTENYIDPPPDQKPKQQLTRTLVAQASALSVFVCHAEDTI
jgi:hypothetical protein